MRGCERGLRAGPCAAWHTVRRCARSLARPSPRRGRRGTGSPVPFDPARDSQAQSYGRAGLLTRSSACAFPTDGSVASCTAVPFSRRNSQQRVLFRRRTGFPFNPARGSGGPIDAKVYLFCGISIFFRNRCACRCRNGWRRRHVRRREGRGAYAVSGGRALGRDMAAEAFCTLLHGERRAFRIIFITLQVTMPLYGPTAAAEA